MGERDRTIAMGLAAGAAAAVGAAAILRRDVRKGENRKTRFSDTADPMDEVSGRGEPGAGPDPESRESGYDLKDAKVSALMKIIAISLTTMIVSTAAVFYMFSRFELAYREPDSALTAEQRAPIVPPLPHLQANPYRDIDAVLMEQTQRLTSYGWNSSDHNGAHIPIERAIQQVIGKPLDGSAQADAAGPKGSDAPQQATPALSADLPQDKPANRVQGEGNPNAVAPSVPPSAKEPRP